MIRPTRAFLLTPSGTGAIGVIRIEGPQATNIIRTVFECDSNKRNDHVHCRETNTKSDDFDAKRDDCDRDPEHLSESPSEPALACAVVPQKDNLLTEHNTPGRLRSGTRGANVQSKVPQLDAKYDVHFLPQPGRLCYGRILDDDEVIDDVILSHTASNPSSTWDISLHGGLRILERALALLARQGAAIPNQLPKISEVWRLGNRIEREILEALGRARTHRTVKFLIHQRTRLADHLNELADRCKAFPHEVQRDLHKLRELGQGGLNLVEGITVAIVGPPNSGKSTLFNRLLEREAVITSDVAGTTRDWVTEKIEYHGLSITLIDTAGQHPSDSEIEQSAIAAGIAQSQSATLQMVVWDVTTALTSDGRNHFKTQMLNSNAIVAWNKCDKGPTTIIKEPAEEPPDKGEELMISAKTGYGIDHLLNRFLEWADLVDTLEKQTAFFTEWQLQTSSDILKLLPDFPNQAAMVIRRDLLGTEITRKLVTF